MTNELFKMNISIIGAGNVATALGKMFLQAGHNILQVIGRSKPSARTLAAALKCPYSLHFEDLSQNADIYFICVQDGEIEKAVVQMAIPQDKIIVHTAGGISINIFDKKFKNFGVFYPLQSLRKENNKLPEIPLFIDANNTATKNILLDIAGTISSRVALADDNIRMELHVAAVFASNFTNYLYALSEAFCREKKIDFSNLYPLISETVQRLEMFSPSEMQTGPALRRDSATIEKHLQLLKDNMEMKTVYQFLSEKIMRHFSGS